MEKKQINKPYSGGASSRTPGFFSVPFQNFTFLSPFFSLGFAFRRCDIYHVFRIHTGYLMKTASVGLRTSMVEDRCILCSKPDSSGSVFYCTEGSLRLVCRLAGEGGPAAAGLLERKASREKREEKNASFFCTKPGKSG